MPIAIAWRNFWRFTLQRCSNDTPYTTFRQFWRRASDGRTACRVRFFVRSSVVYAAMRYGLSACGGGLMLSATLLTTNDDTSFEQKSTFIKSKDTENSSASAPSHSKQYLPDFNHLNENWDQIYEEENIRVFRRYRDDFGGIYEYKCIGTYNDITPINFVETQNDVDYRKKWDENVISLEVVDVDGETDTQIISWVARYPYPMYAREYIYKCRKYVDNVTQTIVIENHAVDTRERPSTSKYVRVTRYKSRLVVRAHSTLNNKGLDYALTYYDDPKSPIPTMAYNWIVHQGGPYFMKKIYQAALDREKFVNPDEETDWERNHIKTKQPTCTQTSQASQIAETAPAASDASVAELK